MAATSIPRLFTDSSHDHSDLCAAFFEGHLVHELNDRVNTSAVAGEEVLVSPTGTGRWKTPIDRWFAVEGPRRAA